MQWTLLTAGKRYFATRQIESNIAALEAQMLSAYNTTAYELKSYLLNLQNADRMILVAERALRSAKTSYDNAVMQYQLQAGTNLDLLTAQSNLANAELTLTSAKSNYLVALSQLYTAMGEIHPDLKP